MLRLSDNLVYEKIILNIKYYALHLTNHMSDVLRGFVDIKTIPALKNLNIYNGSRLIT